MDPKSFVCCCRRCWWRLCCCYILFQSTTILSASTPSYSSSALILDRYGDAVQLRHALAAHEQGSFVMVLDRSHPDTDNHGRNGRLLVVSTCDYDDTGGVDSGSYLRSRFVTSKRVDQSSTSQDGLGNLYKGSSYFMNPIVSSFSHSFSSDKSAFPGLNTGGVAVVCVGVLADAKWLLGRLQEYATMVWERTDTKIGFHGILSAISTLLCRSATKYPFVSNSYGTVLENLLKLQERDSIYEMQTISWSRPLGLCTLVLDLSATKTKGEPRIYRIDPSGMVQPIISKFACLGRHSFEMQRWWENHVYANKNNRHDSEPNSDLEVLQLLHQGLTQVLGQDRLPKFLRVEMWSAAGTSQDDDPTMIDRRIVSLQTVATQQLQHQKS